MAQVWRSGVLLGMTGLVLASLSAPWRPLWADGHSDVDVKNRVDVKPTAVDSNKIDSKNNDKRPGATKPDQTPKPDKSAANAKPDATVTKASPAKLTPEREATAMAFAQENHAELATLLTNLKQNNPTEYRAAVVELDRIAERLALLKSKNALQYDSELTHWKMDSRIRLLAARLTMSGNPTLEAELKAAVREKVELTLTERRAERDRLQKRVEKLDQTIGELSTRLDEATEKELAAVKRSLQSNKPTAKAKPAKKGDEHAAAKPTERSTKETTVNDKPSDAKITSPKQPLNKSQTPNK